MSEEVICALLRDFSKHGERAIAEVRSKHPAVYLRVLGLFIPREHRVETTNPMSELSDDQLASMIDHVRGQLEERLRSERVARVIDGRRWR